MDRSSSSIGFRLRLFLTGLLFVVGVPSLHTAVSQSSPAAPPETPDRGVVWTPPSPPDSALADLHRIAEFGATAVRCTRLPSDTVAARADSLGLRLYVDLPVPRARTSALEDTLSGIPPILDRLLTLADRHASLTHVGLGVNIDSTIPSTCATLRRWTDQIHDQAPSLQTYYVTPFAPTADQCAGAVDRRLLNLRGHPTPVERWQTRQARADAIGIGALGTWMRPTAPSGLRIPRSPERQARYLEDAFSRLLDSTRTAPPTLFVSRWRDATAPLLSFRRYGLHTADGAPRPAARVVRGVYTSTQRTFAFPSGSPPEDSYGLILLGWGLAGVLGVLYAGSLFVRQTVVRYFTAPGFYRDALRDGRDLHPDANGVLLSVLAGALGLTGTRAAQLAAAHPATERVLDAVPRGIQHTLRPALEHPAWAGAVIGGTVLGLLLLWMGALVLTARLATHFSLSQGLVLVTWPCWPALLCPPIALATGPHAPVTPAVFGLLLLVGLPLALVYVTARVLFDYWTTTDAPAWAFLPLFGLSPLAVGGGLLIAAGQQGVSFAFLWRLVTQT